jgi:hypothetical protein
MWQIGEVECEGVLQGVIPAGNRQDHMTYPAHMNNVYILPLPTRVRINSTWMKVTDSGVHAPGHDELRVAETGHLLDVRTESGRDDSDLVA